jgi:hypothetical protein
MEVSHYQFKRRSGHCNDGCAESDKCSEVPTIDAPLLPADYETSNHQPDHDKSNWKQDVHS